MALDHSQAVKLARELRDLRESVDTELTQVQLAQALSAEGSKVAAATVSSWESITSPKTPSSSRLTALARFYSSTRSLEGEPHLLAEDDLAPDEITRFKALESRLLDLANPATRMTRSLQFESGHVVVICPTMPLELRGPLADEQDPNYMKLRQYGDLDALIEIYGHLRAENPTLDVFHRIDTNIINDDLTSHVVLVGGVGWSKATRRFQLAVRQLPVKQIEVDDLETGEIFTFPTERGEERVYPLYEDLGDGNELIADIGFLARLRNPFRINRTLTICNGIQSRGVYGAVRALTDKEVREENERYLANRFPGGEFAVLFQVPVVNNETASPDLNDPSRRLFEWSPGRDRSW